jgi:hypothetical protein
LAGFIPLAAFFIVYFLQMILDKRYKTASLCVLILILNGLALARPMPKWVSKIRPIDYSYIYNHHYRPLSHIAANRGEYLKAARILEGMSSSEPDVLSEIGHKKLTLYEADIKIISIYKDAYEKCRDYYLKAGDRSNALRMENKSKRLTKIKPPN